MNSEIKLEVGKTYEVRNPSEAARRKRPTKVKIVFESHKWWPYTFGGDDLGTYTQYGRENSKKSPFDLVREVTP